MYTSVLIGTPGTLGWPRVCDVVQAGVQRVCTYATMENEREANGGSCLKLAASRVYRLERAWINERSNNRKWSPRRYSRDGGERGWRRDSERPHRWKLYQLSGLERWYRRSRNLYVLAINMRITRYPLNGVGARKRDPISDLQLPPSRFLSNETRFLLLSANDPRFLDLERSRGGKLVRSPLGRGWEDGFPV